MNVYIIMQSNGYGSSAVNSTWATKAEAEGECKRLQTSQERYDNDYYVVEKQLQGDVAINKIAERWEMEIRHNLHLTDVLKNVAHSIELLNLPQPDKCLFGYGASCCVPIDNCLNCPCHPWSIDYMPLTSCEFK